MSSLWRSKVPEDGEATPPTCVNISAADNDHVQVLSRRGFSNKKDMRWSTPTKRHGIISSRPIDDVLKPDEIVPIYNPVRLRPGLAALSEAPATVGSSGDHAFERALLNDMLPGAGGAAKGGMRFTRAQSRGSKPAGWRQTAQAAARSAQSKKSPDGNIRAPRPALRPSASTGNISPRLAPGRAERQRQEMNSGTLIASMAGRLRALEASTGKLRQELVAKERDCLRLQRQLKAVDASNDATKLAAVVEENMRLKEQVVAMEKFLSDYGLTWVGNKTEEAGGPENGGDFVPDFDLVLKRVSALNVIAGEDQARIVQREGNKARLRFPKPVAVTLYKNGILVKRGPMRPYTDETARRFIRDLEDGYFPWEFKDAYPDGVVLNLVDKREELGGARAVGRRGRKLSGGPANVTRLAAIGNPELPMSAAQFLRNLPPSVIEDGQVVSVRDGVAKRLDRSPRRVTGRDDGGAKAAEGRAQSGVIVVKTDLVRRIARGESTETSSTTTLQVRSSDGATTLIIKLEGDATIGDVRRYLDAHRAGTGAYQLRTTYPNRSYEEDDETLQHAGLVPQARMMMRVVTAPGK